MTAPALPRPADPPPRPAAQHRRTRTPPAWDATAPRAGHVARREAWRDAAIIVVFNHAVLLAAALAGPSPPVDLALDGLLGVGVAAGAMVVLHDAMHLRFSGRHSWLNSAVVHVAVPFAFAVERRSRQHLGVHHRHPGLYPVDDFTVASAVVRTHDAAPRRPWQRYQHCYVWVAYSLFWPIDQLSQLILIVDGTPRRQGWDRRRPTALATAYMADHLAAAAVLAPYVALMGPGRFAALAAPALGLGGLLTATVLAAGHISEGLRLPAACDPPSTRLQQVRSSTASFAVDNDVLGWLTGGLTRHLAHHVYPDAPRSRLRHLHHRLVDTRTATAGAAPVVYPTLTAAVAAHGRKMRQLGHLGPPPRSQLASPEPTPLAATAERPQPRPRRLTE